MRSHIWLPLALVLGLGGIAHAQPLPYPGPRHLPYPAPTRVAAGEAAAETLREGMDKLLAFLDQKEKPNKLQVAAFLDGTIAPYFDFEYMAKWVAGARYVRMSPKQREAMAASLEARFLGALAGKLARYKGQTVRYFRPRRGARGAVSVTVGIRQPGSYPSKLEFRMYRSGDKWRVYDVVANGRSAVAFYRQETLRSSARGRPGAYGD